MTAIPRGSEAWQRSVRAVFRFISFFECLTWVGMLTGMAFKYLINGNGLGVTIFGWIHGVTWLVYIVVVVVALVTFRWKIWVGLIGLIASVFPFLTWPFEAWMLRSGRIEIASKSSENRSEGVEKEEEVSTSTMLDA